MATSLDVICTRIQVLAPKTIISNSADQTTYL